MILKFKTVYEGDRGDLVWLNFSPQSGHEQAGRRPAICPSPKEYNSKTGLGIFCPITSKVKGYPFEVLLPKELPIRGVILADQIRSLDWKARNAEFISKAPKRGFGRSFKFTPSASFYLKFHNHFRSFPPKPLKPHWLFQKPFLYPIKGGLYFLH